MTNQAITLPTLPSNVVSFTNNQVKTSSLNVAEHFGKRHDNILRTIKSLDCSPEFRLLNFEETTYMRENPKGGLGISSESYEMTKDGFMFLVMGFTGKKAAAIKEAYINAFNAMYQKISEQNRAALEKSLKELDEVYICPEQKAVLQEIVARKVGGNYSQRAQVWARHNNHFKINSYHCLPSHCFTESVAYLEAMELKTPYALQPAKSNTVDVDKDNLYCLLRYVSKLTEFWGAEMDPVLVQMKSPLANNLAEYRSVSKVIAQSMLSRHFADKLQVRLLN